MGGVRVMLPLWWPRTACIYCGERIDIGRSGAGRDQNDGRAQRHRVHDPRWLACDRHARLVPRDPLVRPDLTIRELTGARDAARRVMERRP